jgi:predicted kinase
MGLALDIDVIKHSLGEWGVDQTAAGLHARRLALAIVAEHLGSGLKVYLGQYLARSEFIEQLRRVASVHDAAFIEIILLVDERTITERLAQRSANPDRPEHLINSTLVSPSDVRGLIQAITAMTARRPRAVTIDASASAEATVELVRERSQPTVETFGTAPRSVMGMRWPVTIRSKRWQRHVWRWPVVTPPIVPPTEPPVFTSEADESRKGR